MVKFLIEENVPLTPLDGKTPLITACEEGQIELVIFMYQNHEKFDFSVRNEEKTRTFGDISQILWGPHTENQKQGLLISYFVHQESGFAKLMETFGPQIWNAIVMTKSKFEALKLKNFIWLTKAVLSLRQLN